MLKLWLLLLMKGSLYSYDKGKLLVKYRRVSIIHVKYSLCNKIL